MCKDFIIKQYLPKTEYIGSGLSRVKGRKHLTKQEVKKATKVASPLTRSQSEVQNSKSRESPEIVPSETACSLTRSIDASSISRESPEIPDLQTPKV